ncbi:MAG: HNH endonuclease signature motif containing protein, partial [Sporichthyaceae bacterium]
AEGGLTDLQNLALLCGIHHDHVHHRDWDIRFGDDGRPELIPPTWVDFEQRPRRNPHWYQRPEDLLTPGPAP